MTLSLDGLAAAVDAQAAGWEPVKRAQLWDALVRQVGTSSPGALAALLDPTTVQTPALARIDAALMAADNGEQTRVAISLPPQEGKSTRAARFGSLWALLRNPDRRVAVVSYAQHLAHGHAAYVRDLVNAWGVDGRKVGGRDLLGLRLDPSSHAAGRWDLAGHRGGMVAAGIGSGLTGKAIDWGVIDDPHADRADADSALRRERVWNWYTDVFLARGPRVVVVVMTRWHEDDLLGRILNQPDAHRWQVINIPAQAEEPSLERPGPDPLGRRPGEYLLSARQGQHDSEVHDGAYFDGQKINARTWASLYQGRPSPAEGGIFQWAWIRPYRVDAAPALTRVVTAVDTTGGGHDEAGIVTAGRARDGRTYVLKDSSGRYTAGGQWRAAWLAALDAESDVLVYEANLVDPVQRRAIPATWARIREQAAALRAAGVTETAPPTDQQLVHAVGLVRGQDDDVASGSAALLDQVEQVAPYVDRVLRAPDRGPARVDKVYATRGKATRAEPASDAYEGGQVSHVGSFPQLEQQLVTWQAGQDSPDRLDALVWAWTYLNTSAPATATAPAGGRIPTGASVAAGRPRAGR